MNIVVADIGGTHARFALAELAPGRRPAVGPMRRYRTREHEDLASAWAAFRADNGGSLPAGAALAVAAPIEGEILTFMNNDWRLERANLKEELGLDQIVLLNDFGAVAHAVAVVTADELEPICGPGELPADGLTTVLGAGTGLGCAILDRRGGRLNVIETEASHIGFSPLDTEEEIVARALAARYGRASVERIVSGPGLIDVFAALGGAGDWNAANAGELWDRAIAGSDAVAARALALWPRALEARDVIGIGPHHVPAKALERMRELVDRAAIELSRGDEFVAGLHQLLEHHDLRGMARGHCKRGGAAFERGHALFQHRVGGVADAGIDVAEGLQAEQRGGVVGVVEDEGCRLINRSRARTGGGIGLCTGMHGEGRKSRKAIAHWGRPVLVV